MAEPSSFAEQLQRLHKLGGDGFVHKMIDLFVETGPPRVETIRTAVEAGDWSAAGQAAHSLKSSAAYLGAAQVEELARRIEELAAGGQAAELPALAANIVEAMNVAISELQRLKKGDTT
jgi:HPt (histidine-containing phosphotransfer) domain-containing protein